MVGVDKDLCLIVEWVVVWLFGCVVGVLLFICNGWGWWMFGVVDYDVLMIEEFLGGILFVGFFVVGEIGLIVGCNVLYGFIVLMVLFVDDME